jgi:hypothetical protein
MQQLICIATYALFICSSVSIANLGQMCITTAQASNQTEIHVQQLIKSTSMCSCSRSTHVFMNHDANLCAVLVHLSSIIDCRNNVRLNS